jgi:hypothetical protein
MIAMWSMSISALIAALRADVIARDAATVTKLASMARITITTSNSTRVKAGRWAEGIPALALRAFMGAEGIPAVALRVFMWAGEIPALALRAFMGAGGIPCVCMVCICVLTKDR